MAVSSAEFMGWARAAVGASLVLAPAAVLRLSGREAPTRVSVLLMRTIGLRDLVVGAGTVTAAWRGSDADLMRWTSVGLASDSLDVLASAVAGPSIGLAEAVGAAAAALAFGAGDLVALAGLRRRSRPTALGEPRLVGLEVPGG